MVNVHACGLYVAVLWPSQLERDVRELTVGDRGVW